MTCILALVDNGTVYMAGDSIALTGRSKETIAARKVFRVGEMLFGVAGTPRLAQILAYMLPVMFQQDTADNERWLVECFIPVLQTTLKDAGWEWAKEENTDSAFLLGYRGKVYTVTSSFSLHTNAYGMVGLGIASEYALGALAALTADNPVVEACLFGAMRIAEQFSSAICAPFYIEKV